MFYTKVLLSEAEESNRSSKTAHFFNLSSKKGIFKKIFGQSSQLWAIPDAISDHPGIPRGNLEVIIPPSPVKVYDIKHSFTVCTWSFFNPSLRARVPDPIYLHLKRKQEHNDHIFYSFADFLSLKNASVFLTQKNLY